MYEYRICKVLMRGGLSVNMYHNSLYNMPEKGEA